MSSSPTSSPASSRVPERRSRLSLAPPEGPPGMLAAPPRKRGESVLLLLSHIGQVARMFWGALRAGTRRPFEGKAIIAQLEAVGVASLGIVFVASVFIGMVMSVQFAYGL